MQRRCTIFEALENRQMLTISSNSVPLVPQTATAASPSLSATSLAPQILGQSKGAREGAEPQYKVHQTPRVQLGNAPLSNTPAFDGFDQIEVMWQTKTIGSGKEDSFSAQIRPVGSDHWQAVQLNAPVDTKVETRIIHSATFRGLDWNRRYEYQVTHKRSESVVNTYYAEFKTRLAPGDPSPFTFAAYGDSSAIDEHVSGFRQVQATINESAAEFSLLLGDNIYPDGSHLQADGRFSAEQNPEAAAWISSHVDYFAMGNHDIVTQDGLPTLQSFSVPIPEQGVNAFVSAPVNEQAEAYSSFDYGDVHFVTVNSNSIEMSRGEARDGRFERQRDFLIANLEASEASWKIVYMHHPLVGSVKFDPFFDTNFLEIVGQGLIDAGVDLVLTGDSHSFAWTYPMSGLNDADGDQEIAPEEIEVVDDSPYEFQKGAGLVQLIAGVGGHRLRDDISFPRPFQAQVYSASPRTFSSTNGHAEITVSESELRVRYIDATTGQIVGDLNGNETRDDHEVEFGEFRIVDHAQSKNADFNQDGVLDALDIDAVCAAIHSGEADERSDFNEDGQVNMDDHDFYLANVLRVPFGDSNLDGIVNSNDLVMIFAAGQYESTEGVSAGWADGDWNCDGVFTSLDLVELFQRGVYVA